MSNNHIAHIVPIGNKRYYYAINNDNNNYYLQILNKQNKLFLENGPHTPSNEITNPFIKLRVQLKLIKVPIMMKPLVAFIFDHQRYKRFKQLRRLYENQ